MSLAAHSCGRVVGSIALDPVYARELAERLNIEANPSTGVYDLDIRDALSAMMSRRGYKSPHRGVPCVMGILAAPLDEGIILQGDHLLILYS